MRNVSLIGPLVLLAMLFAVPVSPDRHEQNITIDSAAISRIPYGPETLTTAKYAPLVLRNRVVGIWWLENPLGSRFEAIGLKPGDRLVRFNGRALCGHTSMPKLLDGMVNGRLASVLVIRASAFIVLRFQPVSGAGLWDQIEPYELPYPDEPNFANSLDQGCQPYPDAAVQHYAKIAARFPDNPYFPRKLGSALSDRRINDCKEFQWRSGPYATQLAWIKARKLQLIAEREMAALDPQSCIDINHSLQELKKLEAEQQLEESRIR